jgi:lipooligosaccharide transport system permease protein
VDRGVRAGPGGAAAGGVAAGPVLAYSATITTDNMFAILYRFACDPHDACSPGCSSRSTSCRWWLRWLAYVSPLLARSRTVRSATLGLATAVPAYWHVAYLAAWAVAGYWLACRRYARKLTD